jgi:hypothetical protein
MAIVNANLDTSEQRVPFSINVGAVANGASGIVCPIPYPCSLDAVQITAFGISGAPNFSLVVNRFISGSGMTAITVAVGTSNLARAYGTSGSKAMVLPAIGSTLTQLQANDVLMFLGGATSSDAVANLSLSLVLRPISDVTKFFGSL